MEQDKPATFDSEASAIITQPATRDNTLQTAGGLSLLTPIHEAHCPTLYGRNYVLHIGSWIARAVHGRSRPHWDSQDCSVCERLAPHASPNKVFVNRAVDGSPSGVEIGLAEGSDAVSAAGSAS